MAAVRSARTVWEGTLTEGSGLLSTGTSSVLVDVPVTWGSRTEDPQGRTSPEELLAASFASCFAMALSGGLTKAGSPPDRLDVSADCTFDQVGDGWKVTTMDVAVRGLVPGIDATGFAKAVADQECPISRALSPDVTILKRGELIE